MRPQTPRNFSKSPSPRRQAPFDRASDQRTPAALQRRDRAQRQRERAVGEKRRSGGGTQQTAQRTGDIGREEITQIDAGEHHGGGSGRVGAAGGVGDGGHQPGSEQGHEKNQKFYEAHLARNRNSINRLTNRIRNSLLTHLEVSEVRAGTGRLEAGRIWRGLYLDDDRIFRRELRSDAGNLSVDILLDASTSQLHRQETVATQGYIIAESLTRCGLPVRVYSFCSMSGYTVVNLFRDYGEKDKNGEIFRYFTTGCNRDGLAVRIAAQMLGKTACEHKLLILLSDAKPNDVVKVDTGGAYLQDYAEQMGVEDTAAEVHRARLDGISVVCVFTGEDADLPAARKIYGQDFSRIRSLEQFADTVGALIQSQIRNL